MKLRSLIAFVPATLALVVLAVTSATKDSPSSVEHGSTETASSQDVPERVELERPKLVSARRIAATVGAGEAAVDAIAASGALHVSLAGFDPWDRLWLRRRHADGVAAQRVAIDADTLLLSDVDAGLVSLELVTGGGAVLDRTTVEVPAGGKARATLQWPPPLERPRSQRLQGEVVVPLLVRESPIARRLTLALVPALDSAEQRRSGVGTRRVAVRRLTQLDAERWWFDFDGVPTGSYELRLEPLCHAQSVVIDGHVPPTHIRVDPGQVGCTVVSFVDGSGRTVHPQSVEVCVRRPPGAPITVPLHVRPDWNAYEWLGAVGSYELRVRDPHYGRRVIPTELTEGWSDLAVTLSAAHRVELALDRPQEVMVTPSPEHFELLALSGGEILSHWTEVIGGARGETALVFEVAQPGSYLARYEPSVGFAPRELRVEVQGDGPVRQPWALGDVRTSR